MAIPREAVATYHVRGIAWKAILSEAVVTEGEALGMSMPNSCLEPTVTDQREVMAVPCLMLMIKVLSSRQSPYVHIPQDCVLGYDRFA